MLCGHACIDFIAVRVAGEGKLKAVTTRLNDGEVDDVIGSDVPDVRIKAAAPKVMPKQNMQGLMQKHGDQLGVGDRPHKVTVPKHMGAVCRHRLDLVAGQLHEYHLEQETGVAGGRYPQT